MSELAAERRALAEHRLTRARETLAEAGLLLGAGHARGAVERYYFAMFQAARALLATRGLDRSKHSGVISLFNHEFVKTGVVGKDLGRMLQTAFDLRIESDYRDFRVFHREEVEELGASAEQFLVGCQRAVATLTRG